MEGEGVVRREWEGTEEGKAGIMNGNIYGRKRRRKKVT